MHLYLLFKLHNHLYNYFLLFIYLFLRDSPQSLTIKHLTRMPTLLKKSGRKGPTVRQRALYSAPCNITCHGKQSEKKKQRTEAVCWTRKT